MVKKFFVALAAGFLVTLGAHAVEQLDIRKITNGTYSALVLINPTMQADTFALTGSWNLVANGVQAGASVIETATGTVTVPACSVMVFVN